MTLRASWPSLDEFRAINRREIAFPLRALAEVALFRANRVWQETTAGKASNPGAELKDSKGRAETLCTRLG